MDENENGLYDTLLVDVTVSVQTAGSYDISGMLSAGTSYDSDTVPTYLGQGISTVTLSFSGLRLSQGNDGPYQITLSLFDNDRWEWIDETKITTGAYQADQFDFVKIEEVKEVLVDENTNGLYEYLGVEIKTNVSFDGNFIITGTLWDSDYGYSVGYERVDTWLSGTGSVLLYFSGQDIYVNGVSGTFGIDVTIYDSAMSEIQEVDIYTPPYDVKIFEHSMIKGLSVSEVDVNSNNLIEYLLADFDAYVLTSDEYDINSRLYDGEGNLMIESGQYGLQLTVGSNPLEVWYSGFWPIDLEADGPYRIEVDLVHQDIYYPYERILFDSQSVTTRQLKVEDFETPSHIYDVKESGFDINGNGYLDGLMFNISVEFMTAGSYAVNIAIYDTEYYEASNTVYVYPSGAGRYDVEVPLYSSAFNNLGRDGPYVLAVLVYNEDNWQVCDFLNYTTGPFVLEDFEHQHLTISDHADENSGNGLYDVLVVDLTLEVTTEVYCNANGVLYDGEMVEIGRAYASLDPFSGTAVVQLVFDGLTIGSRKVAGPMTLEYQVFTGLGQFIGTYMTDPYDYTEFEHVIGTGSGTDHGVDEDHDGLFEYLVVDIEVESTVAGEFFAFGILQDQSGSSWITWISINFHLEQGTQTVRFNVGGTAILGSSVIGPYLLTYILGYDSVMLGGGQYQTSDYLASSFEPPAILATTATDRIQSGSLVVDVGVDVSSSGWYTLSGEISVQYYYGWQVVQGTNVQVYLDVGSQTASITFSGSILRNNGVDGPYRVVLQLIDSSSNSCGYMEHMTEAYSWSEFYGPASITGCSDHLNDIDGNGLAEQLLVEVELDVRVSGTYLVQVYCTDGYWYGIGSYNEYQYLEEGLQTVALPLMARLFLDHGLDGPYWMELMVSDSGGTFYNYFTYWSQPYSLTEMEWPAYMVQPPTDYGLDTDGDGLYEYLAIELMVMVDKPGQYELDSYLRDGAGTQLDMFWSIRWMNAGMNKVLLLFPGSMIIDNMLQGQINYEIDLWWLGPNGVDLFLEYYPGWTSGVYDHEMFEPSTRMQYPNPWVDGLVDTNRNGLYDWLEVVVTINVAQAGKYTITCELYANRVNDLITSRSISWDLKEGAQTLRIRLPGTEIWAKGLDGPYFKLVRLSDRWDNPIDEGFGMVSPDCGPDDFETFKFDIKGGKCGVVDLRSNDPIEVVIYGSRFVLVKYIDPRSVLLGVGEDRIEPYKWALKDVDHDGYADLVLKFKSKDIKEMLGPGEELLVLQFEYKGSMLQLEKLVCVRSGRCDR